MYRIHDYKYVPILIGGEVRYRVELPLGATPIVYKTLTTGMRCWHGQVVESSQGCAKALIQEGGQVVLISGDLVGPVHPEHPCYVMEHLTIDGEMELMIGDRNILNGDQNFVNFGVPNGKHVRIDIYTGASRVIE
jgi:hypothetical protein